MELLNDAVVITFVIIVGFVGVNLINRAKKTKLVNLYALALTLFCETIGYLFYTSIFNNIFLFYIFISVMWFPFIIFVEKTFYQDKKSPFKIFLVLTTFLSIITCVIIGIYQFGPVQDLNTLFIGRILFSTVMGITVAWLLYASFTSYIKIKSVEGVEPWIKSRYLLVFLYTFGQLGIAITWPFFPYDKSINAPYMIGALCLVVLILGQFLAWVMPTGFKRWLNRNYKSVEEEEDLSEEEIMKSFKEG